MQTIPMQLSQKEETCFQFFGRFLKSSVNFEHLQKRDDSHSLDISKITDSEKHG